MSMSSQRRFSELHCYSGPVFVIGKLEGGQQGQMKKFTLKVPKGKPNSSKRVIRVWQTKFA